MEYSELREGDRPWASTNGDNGERGTETPLLEDCFRCIEKEDPFVDALSSSSELSAGTDRMLAA